VKPLPQRWLLQAEADLSAARDSERSGHYEWACFQAQQSAEKAVKALLYSEGVTSIMTHSVTDLVTKAAEFSPEVGAMGAAARRLDSFYLSTRYPNALASDLPPAQFHSQEDAAQCLSYAESILSAVKRYFAG
jgi:HEPN domain-containing protein